MEVFDEFGKPEELFCFPEELLEKYNANGIYGVISGRRALHSCYQIVNFPVITYRTDNKTGFYYDTKLYLLAISPKHKALGCIGFEIIEKSKTAVIIQIQGSKGIKTKAKWDKLLLHTLCDWAFKSTPITQIRIVSSYHVPYWPQSRDGTAFGDPFQTDGTKLRERLHMRYDVLPFRFGFRPSQRTASAKYVRAGLKLYMPKQHSYSYQFITPEMYFAKH